MPYAVLTNDRKLRIAVAQHARSHAAAGRPPRTTDTTQSADSSSRMMVASRSYFDPFVRFFLVAPACCRALRLTENTTRAFGLINKSSFFLR